MWGDEEETNWWEEQPTEEAYAPALESTEPAPAAGESYEAAPTYEEGRPPANEFPNIDFGGGETTEPVSGPRVQMRQPSGADTSDPNYNPRDEMIERDSASWEKRLRQEASARGLEFHPSDLAGVQRQASYAQNAGRDPADWINEQIKIYDRRMKPTLSAGGRGGDLDLDGDGIRDLPTSGARSAPARGAARPVTGTARPSPRGGPSGEHTNPDGMSENDWLEYFMNQGGQFGGPGDNGVFPAPVQQVGQDPLSQLITGGYSDIIGSYGQTALGKDLEQTLRGLIERGGAIDQDPTDKAARLEAARQPIDALRRAQIDSTRGELAGRGLLSEPGAPQGSEIGALGRIEERIAPYYATAAQQLAGEDVQAQNERLSQALSQAGNLSQAQSAMFLASLQGAGERQEMLSQIALQTLDRNLLWNQFLAELGIERGQALEAMERGRIEDLQPLLMMFKQYVDTAAGGYI